MNSRERILSAIRRQNVPEMPLPDWTTAGTALSSDRANAQSASVPWITYPDKYAQFTSVVEMIGGRVIRAAGPSEVQAALAAIPAYTAAKVILSTVPEVTPGNVDLNQIDDPHRLADVDFAILPGEFGVAENGAVWVTDAAIKHRVSYFIPQHLALVVPASGLVDNMHQAYERLSFSAAGFGVFIAGPSKTADIEQSLVIGAHGPRSATVFLIGDR